MVLLASRAEAQGVRELVVLERPIRNCVRVGLSVPFLGLYIVG